MNKLTKRCARLGPDNELIKVSNSVSHPTSESARQQLSSTDQFHEFVAFTRTRQFQNNRLSFDKSPELTQSRSKIVKNWHLSFNEANLTNYKQFGVKSKSISARTGGVPKSRQNAAVNQTNQNFAQSFFSKRLQLKSAISSDV